MSENFKESTALTGARQTMASWTKVIESYEEVPAIYRSFFESYIADGRQFPYTLLTPSFAKAQGRTTEKMIFDSVDAIHILERMDSQVVAKSYPYRSVYSVEIGSVLLSSWLTISGLTSTGEADISTIDYNTSSARHFAAFINKLRPIYQAVDQSQLIAERNKFNYLSTLNFKFMNYGRSSLVSGDIVLQILLQPEIREPLWAPLGDMFQRTISLAHLVILTNHELILIQDVRETGRKLVRSNYGGVWQYIPLRAIKSVTWAEAENDRLTLSIVISPDKRIERLVAISSKAEVEQLCACFK